MGKYMIISFSMSKSHELIIVLLLKYMKTKTFLTLTCTHDGHTQPST